MAGTLQSLAVLIDTGIIDTLIAIKSGEPPGCKSLPPVARPDASFSTPAKVRSSIRVYGIRLLARFDVFFEDTGGAFGLVTKVGITPGG